MSSEEPSTKSTKLFFDTYAIIEIYEGNPAYAKYQEMAFFTTKLNLFELHQYFLRVAGNESFADSEIEKYTRHLQDFSMEIVKKASKLREKHKHNSSMTDCIGYICAKENGLVFVTGDNAFKEMESVEFVQ